MNDAIAVEGLKKRFAEVEAVSGLSFVVRRGELFGFLGPNGAGKTTMMKILTTFISPTAGTAKVAGYDVLDDSLEVRRRLGYLPEQCPIYDDVTVYEYLEYVAEARDLPADRLQQRLYRTLELCGLTGRVDQIIGTLSKGYRQRVGLAQAMIHEPDVLILDEPTSGLDPNQIVEIREVIKRIGREKTVILSTHILSEVQATCDRVVIINQGRLIADGTPDDLVRQMGSNDLVVGLKRSGCKLEEARELLGKLPGVVSVGEQRGEELRTLLLRLGVGGKQDVRPELFRAVVERGWVLLELRRAEHNLEDVFRQLTTGK